MQVLVRSEKEKKSRKCQTKLSIFHHHLDISKDKWAKMTTANGWNSVELRDNRYNQIVHMVSAANGAEDFYSTEVRINLKILHVI